MSNQDAASKGLDPATASGSISLKAQAVDKDRMLSIVFEIAKTLATEQDLEAIVTRVLSSIIEIAGVADAGIVLLYDSSDGWLKVEAAQGYDLSILKQVHRFGTTAERSVHSINCRPDPNWSPGTGEPVSIHKIHFYRPGLPTGRG